MSRQKVVFGVINTIKRECMRYLVNVRVTVQDIQMPYKWVRQPGIFLQEQSIKTEWQQLYSTAIVIPWIQSKVGGMIINFTLKDKERFGIVGYNGAGKTSRALLLTRMYDPTDGDIYLNGINIKEINYKIMYWSWFGFNVSASDNVLSLYEIALHLQ